MKHFKLHRKSANAPLALLCNILLLYVAYGCTRLVFFLENHTTYEYLWESDKVLSIVLGGLYFDTSAIAYTNALYILLVLFPLHLKETETWQRFCQWLYLIINGIGLAMNLGDTVYFQYTARRTTIAFFSEFSGDEKIGSIIGYEFIQHWYLTLTFIGLMFFLYVFYMTPQKRTIPRKCYYITQTLSLLIAV